MENSSENQTENRSEEEKEKSDEPKKRVPTPEEIQREFQNIIRDKFGGMVQVFSMDQQDASGAEEPSESTTEPADLTFDYNPRDIVKLLDEQIIGQEEAKRALAIAVCDHYRHIQAEQKGDSAQHYQKQNVLFLGPTGVGKTFLVRSIAKLIGVPFVKADATRFSETGYMGANVDDIVRDLVQQAKGDINLAESGIVYVDEIDKIAGSRDKIGRDVSGRGVQFGFLRLLEDAEVDINGSHDIASQFKTFMSLQKKGVAEKEVVSTKNILFIFSGAFPELTEIIKKRTQDHNIGIRANIVTKEEENTYDYLTQVKPEDLSEFGFEREFVGRIPVITACHPLSQGHLYQILKNSKASIIFQYIRSFKHYGIDLKFTDESLQMISERASKQDTGARALVQVCEKLLREFKYELPSRGVKELRVTKEMIENPQSYLQYVIASAGH